MWISPGHLKLPKKERKMPKWTPVNTTQQLPVCKPGRDITDITESICSFNDSRHAVNAVSENDISRLGSVEIGDIYIQIY